MTFRSMAFAAMFAMPGPVSGDPATTGTLLGDARVIVTSDKADIRIWDHPPRVLILADDQSVEILRAYIAMLNTIVSPTFGAALFGSVHAMAVPADIGAGDERLWVRMVKGGPSGAQISLNLGQGHRYVADILVVVADRPEIAMINGLWAMAPFRTRSQLQGGPSRCFYESRSREGRLLGAYVSIVRPADREMLEECLWEELLHSLGPLSDAQGSTFFTFDNQVSWPQGTAGQDDIAARKKANDLTLIRALYESGAGPGGAPDQVIAYLDRILNDR